MDCSIIVSRKGVGVKKVDAVGTVSRHDSYVAMNNPV